MATLDLPRERYDALRVGDTISVHYFPAFPLLARAANRTTLQAVEDAGGRLLANRSVLPSVTWFLLGAAALWIASWVATPVIVVTGLAWMGAGLLLLFPRVPLAPPGPVTANARVAALNLITKAPARTRSRRHRAGRAFGDEARWLAMPYQVVQLRLGAPGSPDSTLAVDAVDSGSVTGLQVGAEVPVRYDPRYPRDARLAVGTRTYLERNRYHFRTPMIGLVLLGILAAWGAGTRRRRARVTPGEGATAISGRT
jgi:hypothetical protein